MVRCPANDSLKVIDSCRRPTVDAAAVGAAMEFRILGSMEVLDGARRVALPAARGRALLAILVLHAGEAVSVEWLIDELWGEHPPATAGTVVQGLVLRLRRLLEPRRHTGEPPAILRTVAGGYVLAVEPDAVDAHRFKRLLDRARRSPIAERSAILGDALRLWHGPALADFRYEPFAQRAITTLEELRLTAIEDRIDTDLALGGSGELVAEIEELIEAHSFRERLRGQLMFALYRGGRQADALKAYQDARATLAEELGIEPGPALRALHRAILRQDPSLDLQPTAVPSEIAQPAADHWLPRERRVVTVVVADLAPSAEPGDDPEAVEHVAARSVDKAVDVLRRHGARAEQGVGHTLVGYFGLPIAHEDDAVRAVRAAFEMKQAVEALNEDTAAVGRIRASVQAGIETGEIVVGGTGTSLRATASGRVVTTASRLQQAAEVGTVIVGAATQRLIKGTAVLKPAEVIGTNRPGGAAATWQVLDVAAVDAPVVKPLPMRGRQSELTRLRTAFRRTARSGTVHRLTIVGEPGIGKSRLATEFIEWIGSDAQIIRGRCPAYGEGITFLPLREAVLEALGPRGRSRMVEILAAEDDPEHVADQIAGAIGLGPPRGRPDELFPAVRLLFEALARPRPLVAVFDDVHWAEPTFLDLLEYLSRRATGPTFLLCLARPELIEERPDWALTGATTDVLVVGPLSLPEIEALIVDRAVQTLPAETSGRIVDTAQGNPLFAEQLLAAFESDTDVDVIPASVRGLLAMRLDRLGPGERDMLRFASVVGMDFTQDALAALLPDDARPFIQPHLGALERKALVARNDGAGFRFRHVLIQRAAYQSMTREDRASLHERHAEWLERDAPTPPPEIDEIVGYHLEQAVQHRRATGVADADLSALAGRAGDRLAAAAERALARLDWAAGENLLSRARSMLPPGHPRRRQVTQSLAEADLVLGRHAQAQEMLVELRDTARARGDESSEWSARLEHARIQFILGPDPVPLEAIRQGAEQAAAFYATAGDDVGQGRASFLLGNVWMRAGMLSAAERAFHESLACADRTGEIREELASRWLIAMVLVSGPTPVSDGISQCEELATVRGMEHPGVLTELARLLAMAGRFDDARGLIEHARKIFIERIRAPRLLRFLADSHATVELLAGHIDLAEQDLRYVMESARETREREPISQAAARLAWVLRLLGRSDEAAALADLSAQMAPSESVTAQALSQAARARSRSDAGDHRAAEILAQAAVGFVPYEMPNLRADVLIDLAEIARAAGQEQSATEAFNEAADLYARKGNTVSAQYKTRALQGAV
jgi:DNA-binding SARP family transcriptional activator/tetratricopeptide (TPR) repeat protein